jgi:hypothetical protein
MSTKLKVGVPLFVAAIVFVSWRVYYPPPVDAISVIAKKLPATASGISLIELVNANYLEYGKNTRFWSFTYFSCVFGSAVLSAFAGVILKLEKIKLSDPAKKDIAASCAAAAALLVTLASTGNFQAKWQANRMAEMEMQNLAYELATTHASNDVVLAEIQRIVREQNLIVVGSSEREGRKDFPPPATGTNQNFQIK